MTETEKEEYKKLAEAYKTPFYLYDEKWLKNRVLMTREKLPGIRTCYAMKAAPMLASFMGGIADRLEVCSPGEYEICLRAGIEPEKLLISGVSKTTESMQRLLSTGGERATFTIESESQMKILSALAGEKGLELPCYLRLSSGNQFGVGREEFLSLTRQIQADPHLRFAGVHFFSGTQKNGKQREKELTMLAGFAKEIEEITKEKPALEYGPGLSVAYFVTEKDNKKDAAGKDPEELEGEMARAALEELSDMVISSGIREAFSDITFEHGRFLAAGSGVYATGITDLKTTEGTSYVITDGGLHQISYFGSMAGMREPYITALTAAGEEEGTFDYMLAGSLCSAHDVLVRKVSLPKLSSGDTLLFHLAGAYCGTEGMSLFLSRDLPAVLVKGEDGSVVTLRGHMGTDRINDGTFQ
ncbi:MAG: alanine racemase [Lachnospiraceae bacterium]|nr:alanine racemase [Lachnospiraceae bacterium]